jgi:hypothetical protein
MSYIWICWHRDSCNVPRRRKTLWFAFWLHIRNIYMYVYMYMHIYIYIYVLLLILSPACYPGFTPFFNERKWVGSKISMLHLSTTCLKSHTNQSWIYCLLYILWSYIQVTTLCDRCPLADITHLNISEGTVRRLSLAGPFAQKFIEKPQNGWLVWHSSSQVRLSRLFGCSTLLLSKVMFNA